ncbi:MAG TPA: transposase [Xanthomonadales bacterium]|nr:transposase [Xanthomonadales bacterium]
MAKRKRRKFSAEFKFETVLEALRGEKSAAQICRERDINENLLSRWKQEFLEQGSSLFARGERAAAAQSESEARIAELERMVGKLTMQIDVLKKASSLWESDWSKNGR